MSDKLRRYFLKTKEVRKLMKCASERTGIDLEQLWKGKINIEVIEADCVEVYLMNGKASLAKVNETLFPTLTFTQYLEILPKVVVDMGAVPHICNGADVMAPGIKRYIGPFKKGGFVLVTDEKHDKRLAIGEILFDENEVAEIKHGRVVRNIHFVGDKVWNIIKTES